VRSRSGKPQTRLTGGAGGGILAGLPELRRLPMKPWITVALLLASALAQAQNPRVLLDTDRGPLLLELDATRAPGTSANFMAYVDGGRFDATLIQRVVPNFVIQGGAFRENGTAITRFPTIASERNNGLSNTPGTIAMALSGNPPNVNSASSDFFINTGANTFLDPNFTVFGRVIWGLKNLQAINTTPTNAAIEQPLRIPLIKRAVRVAPDRFPILPLHSGTWYDPAKSGRGFLVEISQVSGSETGPLLVVSWYDYFEGEQIWMSGAAPYSWGASEVEVPMVITRGGQFGEAFEADQVIRDVDWGRLTVRFTDCDAGVFSYTSEYGNGSVSVISLTMPADASCAGN